MQVTAELINGAAEHGRMFNYKRLLGTLSLRVEPFQQLKSLLQAECFKPFIKIDVFSEFWNIIKIPALNYFELMKGKLIPYAYQ
jgi:hypothetical protein